MKVFLALLALLFAFPAAADQITFGDAAIEYQIGMKERKLVSAIDAAGMQTFTYISPLPLWGDVIDTRWSIDHDIKKASEYTPSTWNGIQIKEPHFYAFDSRLYAVRFEAPGDDFKRLSEALIAEYGEPSVYSWEQQTTVSINGKSRKGTYYPHQYSWVTGENTGIKITVTKDKKGKTVSNMTVATMQTKLHRDE